MDGAKTIMNILYLGDIMGEPGVQVVEKNLPDLRIEHSVDVVIAQAENVTNGKSMSRKDMARLQKAGVDVFSGGNHTVERSELKPLLVDPSSPVIAPANMKANEGKRWYRHRTVHGDVVVASILGTMFNKPQIIIENPLQTIDAILGELQPLPAAIVINFHADYSSEKRAFGFYVDGKISLAVGDHWHVPTADAQILPGGTAYITDVGMCGTQQSVLGVKTGNIIERMRDEEKNYNVLETEGPRQLCAVLAAIDPSTGRAESIQQIIATTKQ